jgi:hypothetical protein
VDLGGVAALATGAAASRDNDDRGLRRVGKMSWSRSDVLLRGVEVALGAAVAAALFLALNSGWFLTGAQKFSDWYAAQVDGLVDINVVSTAVTLPKIGREDLPIPDRDSLALNMTDDGPRATSSVGAEASPPAAD